MTVLALSVLMASLVGSVHCAGMCGPFACLAARGGRGDGHLGHLAYHVGRLLAYVTLGAVAGFVGHALDDAAALAGLSRAAALVAAILVVGWGAAHLLQGAGVALPAFPSLAGPRETLRRLIRRAERVPALARGGLLGLATALLPCGWLYAFVVTAAGSGRADDGAVIMLLFWAGTLPALATVGAGAGRVLARLGARAPVVAGVLLVVVGLASIALRLRAPLAAPHAGHGAHPAAPLSLTPPAR